MSPPAQPSPPRWATRLAALRLPSDRREFVLGDLTEEFDHRLAARGLSAARRWYWSQACRIAVSRHPRVLTKETAAHAAHRTLWRDVGQDVRYALRGLRRDPTFAAAAVATLALGIGANAAVFRVAWQVLPKPLPYPAAERIVRVWEAYSRNGSTLTNIVAPGNFVDWQRDTRLFESFAAHSTLRSTADLTDAGEPVQLTVRYVTPQYFAVFGLRPIAGRTIDDVEAAARSQAAVISEGVWRRRFGGDPAAIGRTIHLSGSAYTLVGVMPAAFGVSAGSTVDAWLSMTLLDAARSNHGAHYLGIVARLKPGVTVESAIHDVQAAARRDSLAFPATNKDTSATVTSLDSERGGGTRPAFALLAGAATFVLFIACANLASLQLARGMSRAREFGIRMALGASSARLVRQWLVESFVLALLGAAAGLAVSSWALARLSRVAPLAVSAGVASGVDTPAILYAVALATLSVVLFASVPAWRTARSAARWITQRSATTDRRTSLLRTTLVTGQLGLAMSLLVGATLLVTSLAEVLDTAPGFDPSGVLAFDVSQPFTTYPTFERRRQLFDDILRNISAIPGVVSTCAINAIPFDENYNMTYVPEGETVPIGAFPRTMTPACFDVLRVPILAGRPFSDHESARVGIVTRSFAERAWPNENPVGRRVHVGVADGAVVDIVGVAADSLQSSLEGRVYPQFYESASTPDIFPPQSVLVRSTVAPTSLFNAVRDAVRRVDAAQSVARLRTLDEVVGQSVSERKFSLGLFAGFAAIALVLAAVGTYGLFVHVVTDRRPEFGIRMALGAEPGGVVRLVLRRAWIAIGLGLAGGAATAYAASGLLRAFVFKLSPTDPRIFAVAAAAMALVAFASAWIPARRAARVDPIETLREN